MEAEKEVIRRLKALMELRSIDALVYPDKRDDTVGVLCTFIPVELILAAGRTPVRLCSGYMETTYKAEVIFPQTFCPIVKSTVGRLMDAEVDIIISATTCDGKKKAAEYLMTKSDVITLEVPHTTETPHARALFLAEIKNLRFALEDRLGTKITSAKLRRAIEVMNRLRSMGEEIQMLRTSGRLWGSHAMLALEASQTMPPTRWMEVATSLLQEAKRSGSIGKRVRIMLTGSPVIMPNWKVPLLIEESGGHIVADDLCTSYKPIYWKVEPRSWSMTDMMIALAEKYLMSLCPCQFPSGPRSVRLRDAVREYRVEGVIHHVLISCHPSGGDAWIMEQVVKEEGVPMMKLETDLSHEDVEQLRTRVEAFLEMIQMKG